MPNISPNPSIEARPVRKAPFALAGAFALLTLPPTLGALSGALAAGPAPRVHRIVIEKMKFGAVPPGIRVGDSILWVNRDMFRHTATARDGSFAIDLPAGKSGRTVVKRAGVIPFYCVYHPAMKGRIDAGP